MTGPSTTRFAVGDFAGWEATQQALSGLRELGVLDRAVSLLGLASLFEREAVPQHLPQVHRFAYSQGPATVCCTRGALAECLAPRGGREAASLGQSLSRWLAADAAQRIQGSIADGILLVWVQVSDADDERRACTGLLTYCLTGVEVHDLVGLRSGTGNGRSDRHH